MLFNYKNFVLFSFVFLFSSSKGMNQNNDNGSLFFDFNQETDSELIESIFKTDYQMLSPNYQEDPYYEGRGVEKIKKWICDKSIICKILRIDNQSLAFLICFIADKNKHNKDIQDGDGVLALMGVHPDYRRKGYGSMVVQYVVNTLNDLKCPSIWLSVNQKNNEAQKIYLKFGFKDTKSKSFREQSTWWVLNLKKQQEQSKQ
jgi:ribosomal protein S18 acetylase RimI-like enzyme